MNSVNDLLLTHDKDNILRIYDLSKESQNPYFSLDFEGKVESSMSTFD